MTSVHSVAPAPKQATSGSSTTASAADAAAGDLFAALVAALLPQIQGLTGEAGGEAGTGTGTTTGGDGTATAAATAAGATTDGDVTVDLTALAAEAAAGQTDLAAGALPLTAADAKAIQGILKALTTPAGSSPAGPVLEALALRRGLTTDTTSSSKTTTTTTATPDAAAAGALDPTAVNAPVAVTTTDTDTDADGDSDSDKAVTAAPAAKAAAAPAKRVEGQSDSSALDATPDGLAQPLSVNHRTAVDAMAASREATSVAAAEPHQQLASVITPLRQRPDGTYHLALRLHPEHLGAVDVDVQLHQGTIEVHVQTQHAEAREILSSHLDDLRRELEQAGLRAGTLDVSDRQQPRQPAPGQGQGQFNGQGQRSPVNPTPAASGPATPTTTARPDRSSPIATADGAVDVDL